MAAHAVRVDTAASSLEALLAGDDVLIERLAAALDRKSAQRAKANEADALVSYCWEQYWAGHASHLPGSARLVSRWRMLERFEAIPTIPAKDAAPAVPGKLLGSCLTSELPPSFAGAYIAWRRLAGVQDMTIRSELITLRACLNWARKGKLCGEHPVREFQTLLPDVLRKRTILSDEQVEALLTASGPLLRAFLLALDGDGRRRGVNLGLEWDAIDWRTGAMVVPVAAAENKKRGQPFLLLAARRAILALPRGYRLHEVTHPTTGARLRIRRTYRLLYREVPYTVTVRGVPKQVVGLEIIGREPPDPGDGPVVKEQDFSHVFTNSSLIIKHRDHFGKPLSGRYIYGLFEAAREAAKVVGEAGETVTLHTFRHRYRYRAERVLRLPVQVAMAIGGWSTIEAYMRYAMPPAEEIAEGHATIEAGASVGR